MLKLVVLISGGGSNLRALLEAASDAEYPARVVAVGADREADGFEHAEHFGDLSEAIMRTGSFAGELIGEPSADLKTMLAGGPIRLFTPYLSR